VANDQFKLSISSFINQYVCNRQILQGSGLPLKAVYPVQSAYGEAFLAPFARIGTMKRLTHGARLCAGQKGYPRKLSEQHPERCDALRLVFDTAALRRRLIESLLVFRDQNPLRLSKLSIMRQ
jgi:hypothetical protein